MNGKISGGEKIMSQTIKAIEKGYGEGSVYFQIGINNCPHKVNVVSINEVQKPLKFDKSGSVSEEILIYAVIIEGGKTFCEIEGNSSLTVYYDVD